MTRRLLTLAALAALASLFCFAADNPNYSGLWKINAAKSDFGPMPQGPIVEYLARSTSMFYALHGVLLWFIASDLRRYSELFRFYLWISLAFAAGLFLTDLSAGLPPRWTLVEGPIVASFIGIILVWFSNLDMDGHSAHTVRHERR